MRIIIFIFLIVAVKASAQSGDNTLAICPGDSIRLFVHSDGADYYTWYRNAQAVYTGVEDQYIATDTGIYEVVAFSKNGCKSLISDAFILTEKGIQAKHDIAYVDRRKTNNIDILANDNKGCWGVDHSSIRIVIPPTQGDIGIRNDGTIDYMPRKYATSKDYLSYEFVDNNGVVSNQANVEIVIGGDCGIIYPNPSQSIVNYRGNVDADKLRLCEVSGKVLKVFTLIDYRKATIDLEDFADGVYLLQVIDRDANMICIFKVFKAHNGQ